MTELTFKTRREFLRDSLMLGGAMAWTVPSFIQATMHSLFTQAANAAVPVTGKDAPILVVVQLAGGNDGLNTIIPYQDDAYFRARPNLAVRRANQLRIQDDWALNDAMKDFQALYDEGALSIVQGVGYPNPNRSHFRSTEIWHTASEASVNEPHGWLGRYFDNQCRGADASCGIAIEPETPQAFASASAKGMTFGNINEFRFLPGGGGREEQILFDQLNKTGGTMAGASISSFSSPRGNKLPGENTIDFLERTAMDAQVNSQRIRDLAARATREGNFPATRIGRELQLIAKLITGGMPTRIYYASQGGYDTHANQNAAHRRLLQDIAEALRAFYAAMKQAGQHERVMVMTFSEFGRRIEENASGGTDHGAAAPLFLIGGKIKRGLIGPAPSLNPADLDGGDIRHQIDFRSVYATLLERHLQSPSAPILFRQFPLLNVI